MLSFPRLGQLFALQSTIRYSSNSDMPVHNRIPIPRYDALEPELQCPPRTSRCRSIDDDRGGSKGDKSSASVGDVSSRQPSGTNEAANSTLLTPLRAQYHKYSPA
jgi:hypothetical protein